MSQCQITLENPIGSYHAGSEVKGQVKCNFESETFLRGIKVRLKCKECTDWVDHRRHTGTNCVLFMEEMLFGSEYGEHDVPPGQYVYPFVFKLPETLPSSYTGSYGSIFYRLKAIVDLPFRTDYKDTVDIDVQAPIDFISKPPSLQEPATYSNEKTICCWCWAKGNLTLDVEVPGIAYVPGETMHFKAIVVNLSEENVSNLRVKFTKTSTYRATKPKSYRKIIPEEIVDFTEHGVGAHNEHTYDLQLKIPENIEVPNFSLCEMFKTEFKLEVTCVMPQALDLTVSINLELGHII